MARCCRTKNLPEEKRIEYAKTVANTAKRLADLMTNILKLNRLENQQIYPQAKAYDVSEQLCECLLQFEPVWEEKGIEIDTAIPENVIVYADADLLSIVWSNLFSNAFKFTESGGKVRVSLSADAQFAAVSVADTGCGMTSDVGAHIFEKVLPGRPFPRRAGKRFGTCPCQAYHGYHRRNHFGKQFRRDWQYLYGAHTEETG